MNITIRCPRCRGKVWRDIEEKGFVDLACINCAKRWHIPKKRLEKVLKQKEAELNGKKATAKKFVLVTSEQGI